MVRLARSQPWSTEATMPRPSRISSRTRSKYTMKESAVKAMATTSPTTPARDRRRSEEHTSELQSRGHLVCRLLLEKKKKKEEQRENEETRRRQIVQRIDDS